ncbi:MFS transporter [Crenobacter sp. SG2305]|uniref:MFS transporter n=1 Tax=Crenobacter oryzisoli TaxID=3056844 RepID=UPI0025AAB364|nr:MFS transporter [Crenobacter sp. SG2305]MDN0084158.1 MFS transporter [Crenobacter sp. SG2305]
MKNDNARIQPPSAASLKGLPWIAAMALFMQTLDATILNTALPSMAASLARSPLEMQSAVISYALTVALLIPVSGWLADRYGTRRVFMIAVALFTVGSLACALSPTLGLLVAARVLQGIGGAMMMPVARLALIRAFPRSELLGVMNFVTMPGLVGPVVGPLLGGWLVEVASWHWVFLINLPIGVAGIWYARRIMPDFTSPIGRLDVTGFALFGGGLVLVSLGLELLGEAAGSRPLALGLAGLGLTMLAGYVRHARLTPSPLVGLGLFRLRTFWIGIAGNLASRLGTGGIPLLLPLMLQVAFHHSAAVAGWMLAPVALAAIAAKSRVTPLIERLGYRRILIGNTLALAVATALFALAGPDTPLLLLIPLLALYGAINSVQLTSMNTLVLADLKPSEVSSGNGMLAVAQQLAISFGIAVSAALLNGYKGSDWLAGADLSRAFQATFVTLGLITSASTLLFLRLKQGDGNTLTSKAAQPQRPVELQEQHG